MVGRILLAGLLAVGLLSAQRNKGGGSSNSDMGMPRPQQPQSKMDVIADKLKLSKDQRDQALNIMNAAFESAQPIGGQIAQGRQLIVQAMVQGQDNTDDFKKLMTAYTNALAQMDGVETTAYSKLYAILKPNQQKAGEQVFAEVMAGMFVRAGGGNRKRGQ
jgi:Spy/CpxP family protein refolding chaperone